MDEITFRRITDADLPFLEALYASTREIELNQTTWSPEEKAAFIKMQFRAQHDHYQKHFGDARFELILKGTTPIGRLYVHRREDEIRIVDIALVPEHRGMGIGGGLMRQLMAEAENTELPLRIHVEQFNPALRLYERLGFQRIRDEGVYFLMERRPNG